MRVRLQTVYELQNETDMLWIIPALLLSNLVEAQVKLKPKPVPRIAIGQCSEKAFSLAKELGQLNGDAVVTTSDKVGHVLTAAKADAQATMLPDKTELWRVTQDYKMDLKSGTVLGRRVIYDLQMQTDPGGFCTILELKRQDKHDYFTETK